jgi:hypothetical protein
MSTKYIVNNVSGQTITGDLTINGNVVITGTTNTRPYKVYTALLTQSGGDDLQVITSGDLIIGVTYEIRSDIVSNADFTNVGAPNNNQGTFFVATGTTPNSWGTSGELRYNTGAPVVTVLENTIGNIWWVYASTGKYILNSDNLFIDNKTFINGASLANISVFNRLINADGTGFNVQRGYLLIKDDTSSIVLRTLEDVDTLADSVIYNPICIEIRVYN